MEMPRPNSPIKFINFSFLGGIFCGILLVMYYNGIGIFDTSAVVIPMDSFPEPSWRRPETLSVRTVASTAFARFEVHKVRAENGQIINDWLWTDERSHVNILVHVKEDNKYLVFRQKKYGLEKDALAVIGGLFNIGEGAIECAQRELMEETGLAAEQMVNLGKYRVQVNRGGGYLHVFFARNCVPSDEYKPKPGEDYEKQNPVRLTRAEMLKAVMNGEFGEAQWVATAALGILYDEHYEHHVNVAQGPKQKIKGGPRQ